MAKKITKRPTLCPDCGDELDDGVSYCFRCGADPASRSDSVAADQTAHECEDDDLPDRASYIFWFDALLFTRLWYIPVALFLAVAVTALVLTGAAKDPGVALMIAAVVTIFVSILVWRSWPLSLRCRARGGRIR